MLQNEACLSCFFSGGKAIIFIFGFSALGRESNLLYIYLKTSTHEELLNVTSTDQQSYFSIVIGKSYILSSLNMYIPRKLEHG